MDGWLPYVVLNTTGLAVFALAWLVARHSKRWRLMAAGVVLALLIFKSVLTHFPVWEVACFPWSWYVFLNSYWLPLFAMVFFGLAVPQLTVPWNRVAVAVFAIGLYIHLGLFGTWWMVSRPQIGSEQTPNAAHHLSQSTPFTCAPCAAAIAVSYVGIIVSERQMADRCLTVPDHGTTVFNTYRGLILSLADSPWKIRMSYATIDHLCEVGRVAVIDFPAIRHAITIVGTGDGVTLHDPLRHEPKPLKKDDLKKRYGGVALVIEPR